MRRKYDSMLPSGDSQMQGGNSETGVRQESPRKQKCRVIITNNYKDYRLLLGAQIIKPSKVRTIAR